MSIGCGSASSYCGAGCLPAFGDCTSSQRLAIRNANHHLEARATSVVQVAATGAGPDYTYPPIPTVTVYATTVYVTIPYVDISSSAVSSLQSQAMGSSVPTSSATLILSSSSVPDAMSSFSGSITATTASITPAMTMSSVVSSTNSAAPSAAPVARPSDFCLRVVTPNTFITGWAIKQSNPGGSNGAFLIDPVVGGKYPTVAHYSIGDQKELTVTTPGTQGILLTGHSRGTGSMFRYTVPYSSFFATTCDIKTDVAGFVGQQILKCTGGFASQSAQTFTGFRYGTVDNNGVNYLFATDDFTTNTPDDFVIELGVFTGDDCLKDSIVSSAVSAASTPTTSSVQQSPADFSATVAVPSSSTVLSSTVLISSSVVAPSPAPVPSNFCLKVVRPGVRSTGWIVRQTNLENGNYRLDPAVGGSNPYTSRFTLDNINQLISTTPGIEPGTRAGYSTSTGSTMRYFSTRATYLGVICSVKSDVSGYEGRQLLKCTGGFRGKVYTGWRQYTFVSSSGERIQWLQGTDNLTTTNDTNDNFLIELGLFTGGDCPVNDVPTALSSASSDVMALSSSVPTPSADPVSSSSVNSVVSSTPTPI
jgi:hypothetical protein